MANLIIQKSQLAKVALILELNNAFAIQLVFRCTGRLDIDVESASHNHIEVIALVALANHDLVASTHALEHRPDDLLLLELVLRVEHLLEEHNRRQRALDLLLVRIAYCLLERYVSLLEQTVLRRFDVLFVAARQLL